MQQLWFMELEQYYKPLHYMYVLFNVQGCLIELATVQATPFSRGHSQKSNYN